MKSFALLAAIGLLASCASGTPASSGADTGGDETSAGEQDLSATETGEAQAGGTLIYASGDAEPSCLDPHVGGNYPQALIATQFLEGLTSRDVDGNIVPWLASEWEWSDDKLTLDVTLRDDVTFHDGTPFNAEAVKVNVEHLQDPETASSTGYLAFAKIEEVEVAGEHLARFHLSEPDSALLESFAQPWNAILAPSGIERGQEENCLAPIGTGPFQVTDWVKQGSVTLTRYDDYNWPPADVDHTGPALLDEIQWRFIPDAATRYAALVSGEVHVIDNVQPDSISAAENQDEIVHLPAPRPGASNRLELNSGKAPFDDPLVREAFIKGIDVDSAIDSLFFGTAPRSYSAMSSAEVEAYSDPALFEVDVAKAEDLLDEAGWSERDAEGYRLKDGERLSLHIPVSTNQSIPAEQSLFEQIQAQAKDLGIEITISLLDLGSWYGELAEHNYNLVSAPYTKVGPDVLRILFHSDSLIPAPSGYFANLAQVDDPEVDAWLEEASRSEGAERSQALQLAQQKVLENHYILPLYDQQNHFLLRNNVQDMRAMPTVSTPSFYAAWLADN